MGGFHFTEAAGFDFTRGVAEDFTFCVSKIFHTSFAYGVLQGLDDFSRSGKSVQRRHAAMPRAPLCPCQKIQVVRLGFFICAARHNIVCVLARNIICGVCRNIIAALCGITGVALCASREKIRQFAKRRIPAEFPRSAAASKLQGVNPIQQVDQPVFVIIDIRLHIVSAN